MKLNDAEELAAHKLALRLQKADSEAKLAALRTENDRLRELGKVIEPTPAHERKLAQLEQAVSAYGALLAQPAPIAAPAPYTYFLDVRGPQNGKAMGKVAKAGPDPRVIRDAVLAAIQKGLVKRLKKFFQGLQLQALRILRAETGEAEVDRPYWEETAADAEIKALIDAVFSEVGDAAFSTANKEYGVAVAWTAENFWLPQYIGMRADLIKGIDANLKTELIVQLREGYAQGEGIPKLSQRVTEVFREAIDWKAERIARTETIQAYAAASLAAYQAGGIEKVQMHDGPHDDKANCIDVDGLVVSLAEAIQLMAEEHPNGVRAVAPFIENMLMPTGTRAAALPPPSSPGMPLEFLGVQAMAFALEAQRKDQQMDRILQQNQALMETIKSLALNNQPPDITIDQPPPPPININVTIPEGAIKMDSHIAEGAFTVNPATVNSKVDFLENSIRVETPVMIPKGMVESNTPITVVMPQPPEVVFEETDE